MLIASFSKLVLASVVMLHGGGVVGLVLSYNLFGVVLSSILLAISIRSIFSMSNAQKDDSTTIDYRKASRKILLASSAAWIPTLVETTGIDLTGIGHIRIPRSRSNRYLFHRLCVWHSSYYHYRLIIYSCIALP